VPKFDIVVFGDHVLFTDIASTLPLRITGSPAASVNEFHNAGGALKESIQPHPGRAFEPLEESGVISSCCMP
jgi:hypothetical protein